MYYTIYSERNCTSDYSSENISEQTSEYDEQEGQNSDLFSSNGDSEGSGDGYISDDYNYTLLRGQTIHNYIEYANKYKLQRPYMDKYKRIICILCLKNDCQDILYPCQHRCICRKCIKAHHIVEYNYLHTINHKTKLTHSNGSESVSCNCPLCGTIIQRILVNERGVEAEQYWSWVYKEAPVMSDVFMNRYVYIPLCIHIVYTLYCMHHIQ